MLTVSRADIIGQIAALPYRRSWFGRVQVMLITSRDTGRWVVPKGNAMADYAPHDAAAQEAWEEAGLRGAISCLPLGQYRYLKRRRSGARMRVVTVFPLRVTAQAREWPECRQRRTRWFTPRAAAARVDEADLAALIAGFRAPTLPSPRALRSGRAGTSGGMGSMLSWFQSLMPRQGRFFELFEAHAATLVAGADALALLLDGEGDAATHIAAIVAHEHTADDITRDILQDVRRVFVTPFDRSAISDLIGTMDDAIDQMNKTANTVTLYGVTRFEPQMRAMAGIVVEAARLTVEAIPLLRALNANAARLHDLTERLIEIEGQADRYHDEGLKALFAMHRDQPMPFIIGREIYSHLEKVVDCFEDVANEIQGLVIDHA